MKLVFKLPKLDVPKLLGSLKRTNYRPSTRRVGRIKPTPQNGKTQ